uniref:uncharacterized protein LOC122603265 isoform X2 n=1 Tax=Erigeron canadensis TaxID=72917 RepID=UPI001CB8C84F|nr:uncharacterized protein LOC122603265 isoform X2 [Erigeron canadensis]
MSLQRTDSIQPVEEEDIEIEQPTAQNPNAPPDELFDISTTVDPSYVISLIRKLVPSTMNASSDITTNGTLVSQSQDNFIQNKCQTIDKQEGRDAADDVCNDRKAAVGDDAWEEHGCVLWDLATSRTHAQLMVENLILDVILATLMVSQSPRVTEISLGILGNLACHEALRKEIVSVKGLVELVVDQLFVDDTPCLCEEFRLLTLCLQGSEGLTWAQALQPENVLSRVLWVVENTMNPQLIEKSAGFLLTISESQDDIRANLLPHLLKLGLPAVLVNLLAFEISKLVGDERLPERYSVLETILRVIEALTVIDSCSQELSSSKKLLHLLGTLIKFADKIEVATSCVTAAVLTANLLSDFDDLILEIYQDLLFLQGLLDIFPFASDDIEARNALWDIISRLLTQVQKGETSPSNLHQYTSILASKSDLIEEELLDHQLAASSNNQENSIASCRNLQIRTAALKRIDSILSQWLASKDQVGTTSFVMEYPVNERDLDRLKDCCRKYSNHL